MGKVNNIEINPFKDMGILSTEEKRLLKYQRLVAIGFKK